MFDVETRRPEFAYLRRQFDRIAEAGWRKKSGAGIDDGDADNIEGGGEVRRRDTQRTREKGSRAPIEEFEEAAIENDSGRIALSPLDPKLPSAEKIGHAVTAGAVSG